MEIFEFLLTYPWNIIVGSGVFLICIVVCVCCGCYFRRRAREQGNEVEKGLGKF